jgi:microcompartment protein CcmL/EutN
MTGNALGFIEAVGLTAAIEAADSAVKSANVRLLGYELARGDGMTTVKIEGDVGAVKAAVKAAGSAAAKVGRVVSVHVIPRPADGTERIVLSRETVGLDRAKKTAPASRHAKAPPESVKTPVGHIQSPPGSAKIPAEPVQSPPESAVPTAEPKDVKKPRSQSKKAKGASEPQSNGDNETPSFELEN